MTNPDYVTSLEKQDYVLKNIPKYNLTKGVNEKIQINFRASHK